MGLSSSPHSTSAGFNDHPVEGEKKCLNSELWHACAGPLVSLPQTGSRVLYFPQGHSEQVAASTNKDGDATIPNYPGLQPRLICQLHNVTMNADVETDEVYAQMTLQPLTPQEQKDICLLPEELGNASKQPTNYFCKTLTASDTSTHGGFSVPRRAAEKVFPPLDYSHTPPCQELLAKDLHGNEWKFKHIFRGQPKRHLLTTGWSVFVSAKRLVAGDSVIFIWNENNQLLLGIRRASRPQTVMPSSVLSSDSMHIGLLAAAAHAAATNTRFTIFYNPRASPSEFVIPLAKYAKAVYHTRVSVGMRFRMLFETDESSVRRYMGTITGISDLDPLRWPNSHWRSVKVGWDESTAGERQPRVSLWEIEPLTTFPMYPSPFSLRLKRPWPSTHPSFAGDMAMSSPASFLRGGFSDQGMQSLNYQGLGVCVSPWIQPRLDPSIHSLTPNSNQRFLQFQQNLPSSSALQMQSQTTQQLHSHPTFADNIPENNTFSQAQFVQNQFTDRKYDDQRQAQKEAPTGSQPQFNAMQTFSSTNQLQNFSDLIGTNMSSSSNNSPMQSLLSSFSSSKRLALEPQILHKASNFGVVPHLEELSPTPNSKVSEVCGVLPPFPGREDFLDFRGSNNSDNNLFFGVNNDSSLDNPMNIMSTPAFVSEVDTTGFHINSDMTTSSCLDESGYSENVDPTNQTSGAFVKVHKTGSFGRSLDISKFSSYPELRSELAHLFGLEELLEDPKRSGWQLIFVDRENDILLIGDDPWQEFVNNVGYIKILSPLEVKQMGRGGLDLPNSDSIHRLSSSSNGCDDHTRSNLNEIPSVGSLEF